MRWILGVFVCLFGITSMAQRNVQDSTLFSTHFAFSYGYQIPGGDMSSRFGDNNTFGVLLNVKTKTNWFFGVDGIYLFGTNVKEPGLLSNLYTDDGEIIDNEGRPAVLRIQERGYVIQLTGGRLFNVIGPNNNSGILVKAGAGFMQHKIRLEHQINKITQLEGEYLKGYDRLTNGLALSQFVGYFHMSNNRLANFYVGAELYEGFTQGRRDFYYDSGIVDDQPRFDALIGLRAGWVIHMYQRTTQEYYYD